jgi:hypothetical protein
MSSSRAASFEDRLIDEAKRFKEQAKGLAPGPERVGHKDLCPAGDANDRRLRSRRQQVGRPASMLGDSANGLQAKLKPLIRKTQPYVKRIGHRGIWVEPELLAEIEYWAKSAEGKVSASRVQGVARGFVRPSDRASTPTEVREPVDGKHAGDCYRCRLCWITAILERCWHRRDRCLPHPAETVTVTGIG